jgi:hypothetical protein
MTRTERKERQRGYNRASRERRSRRVMMLERSTALLSAPAPQEGGYGAILRLLAAAEDRDAQRLFAICVDVAEAGVDVMEDATSIAMIAASHDY